MKNFKKSHLFQETKLYKIYLKLDELKRERFRDFVKSPYNNPSKKLIPFWDHFEKFSKKVKKDSTLISFYKKLHPERFPKGKLTYKDKDDIANKVRRLNSEMWELIREFLGMEIYQSKSFLKSKFIYDGFLELNPEGGHKDFQFSHIESQMNSGEVSPEKLSLLYQLWADRITSQHVQQNTSLVSDLEETVYHLDEYYFTERVFYELENRTLNRRFTETPKGALFQNILPLFEDQISTFNPLARGGYYLYLAFSQPENLAHFENLLLLIEEYESEIEEGSIRNLTTGVINLLVRLKNENQEKYQQRLLESYLIVLEKGWICIDNQLEVRHFNNVITLLLQNEEISKAEKVFAEWQHRLLTTSPDFAQNFNYGRILLEKYELVKNKKDSKGEELLYKAENCFREVYLKFTQKDDFLFDFNAHLLMYRSYYLRKNWNDIESFYEGFCSHFENHKKCSEARRKTGLNFIKAVFNLNKWQNSKNRDLSKLKKIREEIEKEPRLTMKPWLLKQIDELL